MTSKITEGQQTQHKVTSGSEGGDWFRSTGIRIIGANQLVFQAKGPRDAILGLATEDRYLYISFCKFMWSGDVQTMGVLVSVNFGCFATSRCERFH